MKDPTSGNELKKMIESVKRNKAALVDQKTFLEETLPGNPDAEKQLREIIFCIQIVERVQRTWETALKVYLWST